MREQPIVVAADVTVREEAEALVRAAEAQLGPIDILVNNAAILFCCVDWSRFVSGAYLPVGGGALMP